MAVIYNQNGETTTNGEQDIPNNLICGNCFYYNKDKEIHSEVLGIIHSCDKGYICNSWNLACNCKDFVDFKNALAQELIKINKNGSYGLIKKETK